MPSSPAEVTVGAPLPFAKHLKITTEKTVGFYNVYYQLYKESPSSRGLRSRTTRSSSTSLNDVAAIPTRSRSQVVGRLSPWPPPRGKSPELELVSLDHAGTIQYIKINPLFAPDPYSLNHVHLRVFYDGRIAASVDVPIGPFFGSGLGEADVRSLFVGMSGSGVYYYYLPMPFRKAIRIASEQELPRRWRVPLDIGYTDSCRRLRAVPTRLFRGQVPPRLAHHRTEDYVLFDYKGRGAVVGQVMTVEPVKPDRKRWWEGDMRITIDGEEKPRFHGTGHEDEYQGGWSTFWLTNPYSLPLFGEPKTENLIDVFGQVNGSTTAYRFWPGKIHLPSRSASPPNTATRTTRPPTTRRSCTTISWPGPRIMCQLELES